MPFEAISRLSRQCHTSQGNHSKVHPKGKEENWTRVKLEDKLETPPLTLPIMRVSCILMHFLRIGHPLGFVVETLGRNFRVDQKY